MKIIFIGAMGVGKTTAIAAVSDIPPVSTEAVNNDQSQSAKATTTVAMDYGEVSLGEDEAVALYGIPGQERFSFMWPILAEGAMGAVLLLNHAQENPIAQLGAYLDAFPELVAKGAVVIGVGHTVKPANEVLPGYSQLLRERELSLPMFMSDVRNRQDVLLLVETLIANAEVNQLLGSL